MPYFLLYRWLSVLPARARTQGLRYRHQYQSRTKFPARSRREALTFSRHAPRRRLLRYRFGGSQAMIAVVF